MSAWGQITDLVLLTLGEIKRGTCHDVAAAADADTEPVRKALDRMARAPFAQRRVHIAEWTTEMAGARNYPRPVYVLGRGGNVKRPPPKAQADVAREYLQRTQAVVVRATGRHLPQRDARQVVAKLRARGVPL